MPRQSFEQVAAPTSPHVTPEPDDHPSFGESVTTMPRVEWSSGQFDRDADYLTREEPLELRIGNAPIAVVMRTPGDDLDLGTGFAVTERIVSDPSDLERVHHCSIGEHAENVLVLVPRNPEQIDLARLQRNLYASSSCGICGKRSIEHALAEAPPLEARLRSTATSLAKLPEALRNLQPTFSLTGGLHAAGLFDAAGRVALVREDIGRHNAVDKAVGAALRAGIAPSSLGVVVSGRASYEIIQKALAARISVVVAVGAVSSLAVELALRASMTLVGFASDHRLCIYSGHDLVDP